MTAPSRDGPEPSRTRHWRAKSKARHRPAGWNLLDNALIGRWMRSSDALLDRGAGQGHRIDQIGAGRMSAMDTNPTIHRETAHRATALDVHRVEQHRPTTRSLRATPLHPTGTGTFLEHMPHGPAVQPPHNRILRILRSGVSGATPLHRRYDIRMSRAACRALAWYGIVRQRRVTP